MKRNKSLLGKIDSDKVFVIVNYIILAFIFIIVAYPIIYIISASFSSSKAIIQGRVKLVPVDISIEGYKAVFQYKSVWKGFSNSVFYTVVGTSLNIIMTVLMAYPLSRKDIMGKKVIMTLLIFTMMFNAGMIPNYLLIKSLHMVDTRASLIIPVAINAYNVIITITYFKTSISDSLLEASKLDGCSDFKFLIKIVIPLSKAVIAVITLYYAVSHWNSYFDAMLYINTPALKPFQIVLRDILVNNQMSNDMLAQMDPESIEIRENLAVLLKYSLIIISSLPMLIMYPFIQKNFVKGVMIGSVKG